MKVSWLMHDKDQREVYKTLMKDEKFARVWRTAQEDGQLRIRSVECLKWNYDQAEGPREDGHYDVEGHGCSDVQGFWRMRWWHPKDLKTLARWTRDWLVEDLWGTLTEGHYWSAHSWKIGLNYVRAVHPFKRHFSGWTWTVNSMRTESDSACWEAAEQAAKAAGYKEPDYSNWLDEPRSLRLSNGHAEWHQAVKKLYDDMRPGWDKAGTIKFIESEDYGMVRLSHHLWVNKFDPTVLVLDEDLVPFDMKSGWSEEALCRVIQEWFKEMLGEAPAVTYEPEEP